MLHLCPCMRGAMGPAAIKCCAERSDIVTGPHMHEVSCHSILCVGCRESGWWMNDIDLTPLLRSVMRG